MTVKIELSEDQAAALTAKAAAQGLSLEDWFQKLAEQQSPKPHYRLNELIEQCDTQAPLSAEDQAWMDAPAFGREAM